VSGYPAAPTPAGALTDFGGNEKFVKELGEAMPLGRGAVFVLLGKMPERCAFEGSTGGEGILFSTFDKSAGRCGTSSFCKVEREWAALIKVEVKELSLWKRRLFAIFCSVGNYCDV
jgi:hypothetical protein